MTLGICDALWAKSYFHAASKGSMYCTVHYTSTSSQSSAGCSALSFTTHAKSVAAEPRAIMGWCQHPGWYLLSIGIVSVRCCQRKTGKQGIEDGDLRDALLSGSVKGGERVQVRLVIWCRKSQKESWLCMSVDEFTICFSAEQSGSKTREPNLSRGPTPPALVHNAHQHH